MSIDLSIGLVLYNSPPRVLEETREHLSRALEFVECHRDSFSWTLELIDNSETPQLSTAELAHWPGNVNYRHGHGNIGFGRAHNLVLSNSTARFHLILNPDVSLTQDALLTGLSYLEKDQSSVMVCPDGTSAEGVPLYLAKRYPSVLVLALRALRLNFLNRLLDSRIAYYECHDLVDKQQPGIVPITSGCCMLGKTSALKAVSGFSDDFFLYFEDFDLSLRLAAQGSINYLPEMRIGHAGGNASRKGLNHIIKFCRSAYIFFNKHGWDWCGTPDK